MAHEPLPPLSFELVNPCYFDLSDLDEVYWDTIAPSPDVAAKKRVIGFVVRYFAHPFLDHLCDRILKHSGGSQTKRIPNLALDSDFAVPDSLDLLCIYKEDFSKKPLFCLVRAESAESTLVEEFWKGVRAEFTGELPNNLLILFTGKVGCPFPSGVVELPKPLFKFGHLQDWTQKMIHHLQWPTPLADRWSSWPFDRSKSGDPPSLDIRRVYVYLAKDIEDLHHDPSNFRVLLEKTG